MREASLRMPLRFLRESWGRLALSVLAVASGVALVCAIDLADRGVARAFLEVIESMAGRAALQVSAGQGGLFPEDVAATVARVPGVEFATPVVSASAFVADETGEHLTVHGVDLTNDGAVRLYEARDEKGLALDDPLVFLSQPDSVVLTRPFARRRGLEEGSSIALETPRGRRTFTVRGLLEPHGVARVYGGNLVVMDLFAAEAAFTRPGLVNRVDVVVGQGADLEAVAAAIAAALPAGLHVETPSQRKADLGKVISSLGTLLSAVGLIALIAAFLIIFNRLSAVFERRAWQLGVLAAVGMPEAAIWRELLKESLLVGSAGVALGIPLGIALGRVILPVIATTAALNSQLVAPETELSVRPASLALAGALGLAAAVLAAALPARRAIQLGIAQVVRSRGVEQEPAAHPTLSPALMVVLAAAVAAFALQSYTRAPGFGLAATGLIVAATALAARPCVALALPVLSPLIRSVAGPGGRLVVAGIRANPRRTALATATLGVGLGAVFWLFTLAQSFERSLAGFLSNAIRPDLAVTSSNIAAGAFEAPVDQTLAAELRDVPGVAGVVGWRQLDWSYGGGPIALSAYDRQYFLDRRFGEPPLERGSPEAAWPAVARGEAVAVSTSFARSFGVDVGDEIALETPTGPLELRVAGIGQQFISPRGTVVMSRELVERHWRDSKLTEIFLLVSPENDAARVQSTIAAELGRRYGLRILRGAELREWIVSQVRRAFSVVSIIAALVLFVVMLGIGDALAASVLERTRELGVIQARGVDSRLLERLIAVESLSLGAIGLLLGACSGLVLGTAWVRTTFAYLLGWTLDLHLPYVQLAITAAVALVVCLAAAWLPARQAASIEPAMALRYE